jgi:GNAT superfamily N-acetyltransferase
LATIKGDVPAEPPTRGDAEKAIGKEVSYPLGIVLQLVRRLDTCPTASPPEGWRLRHYAGGNDVKIWLSLREAAFADSPINVRRWTPADFARELTSKSWWRPESLWFVESTEAGDPLVGAGAARAIGTATLAWRGSADGRKPVIHWLGVLPEYRRRGVGRLLMAQLEQLAWHSGGREVALETHTAWTDAVAFYRALGYRAVQA